MKDFISRGNQCFDIIWCKNKAVFFNFFYLNRVIPSLFSTEEIVGRNSKKRDKSIAFLPFYKLLKNVLTFTLKYDMIIVEHFNVLYYEFIPFVYICQ